MGSESCSLCASPNLAIESGYATLDDDTVVCSRCLIEGRLDTLDTAQRAEAYYQFGLELWRLKRLDEARWALLKSCEILPSADAYAVAALTMVNPHDSFSFMQMAIAMEPSNEQALMNMPSILHEMGDFAKAFEWLEEHPWKVDCPEYLFFKAKLLLKMDRCMDAEMLVEQIMAHQSKAEQQQTHKRWRALLDEVPS